MCGRFSLFAPKEDVEERFDARFEAPYERRYNASPGQSLPVITDAAPDRIANAEWGLQPSWADERGDAGFVNARAETAAEKRSFADAMAGAAVDGATGPDAEGATAGRCLVPADGYYEWAGESDESDGDGARQPYRLQRPGGDLFAMAGLWTRWRPAHAQASLDEFGGPPDEPDSVDTFAVLTTAPSEAAGHVHDRMPAILPPDEERTWLAADRDEASGLLRPDEGALEVFAVSSRVNDPANDDPGVVRPLEG